MIRVFRVFRGPSQTVIRVFRVFRGPSQTVIRVFRVFRGLSHTVIRVFRGPESDRDPRMPRPTRGPL